MKAKLFFWGGVGIILLLLSIIISMSFGTAMIPFTEVWSIVWSTFIHRVFGIGEGSTASVAYQSIILDVRMPRVVLAILVGAALSLAGAGFQGVLRNPLADPYTLGVASGASFGAAFLISFGLHYYLFGQWTVPVVAFITGMISLLIVMRLASVNGKFRVETMILAGVVVQAFFGAVVSLFISMSNSVVNDIVFWLMGSLKLRDWSFSMVMAPYLLIGGTLLLYFARPLNLFSLGERQAAHLGVRVERTKRTVLIIGTFLSAAAVSVSGTIGFVGLVTPHLMRLLVGPDYRLLLPLSAIYGGIYVLWADTLARLLLDSTELPLGVVTAFLGAPFFAWLLVRHKRRMVV